MKYFIVLLMWMGGGLGVRAQGGGLRAQGDGLRWFAADDPHIQYMGRIDFSDPKLPRFWAPGVVVRFRFRGAHCRVLLRDQAPNGNTNNYIVLLAGNHMSYRVKLRGHADTLDIRAGGKASLNDSVLGSPVVVSPLPPDDDSTAVQTVTICKATESGIGWMEMEGVYARELVPPPALPGRKIECIGNSITCGAGSDVKAIPCGQGQWYDQHNAWMSYGALTARALNAQWQLTSVSGIGLIHSCCQMNITMPQVFDKLDGRDNTGEWDFGRYQPDVVTVCLGQNDGIQDSTAFCGAYVGFIGRIRRVYPNAQIVLLTSPMGNSELTAVLKRYIGGVVAAMVQAGDGRVHSYFFSKQYSRGCGGHPDIGEHLQIAAELTGYLKGLMGW